MCLYVFIMLFPFMTDLIISIVCVSVCVSVYMPMASSTFFCPCLYLLSVFILSFKIKIKISEPFHQILWSVNLELNLPDVRSIHFFFSSPKSDIYRCTVHNNVNTDLVHVRNWLYLTDAIDFQNLLKDLLTSLSMCVRALLSFLPLWLVSGVRLI